MSFRADGILSVLIAASALAQPNQSNQEPRYLQGIYVKVYASDASSIPTLAANPAIAGLTLSVPWVDLNPNPPTSTTLPEPLDCKHLPNYAPGDSYDWTLLDAGFCAAAAANPPRTIWLNADAGV